MIYFRHENFNDHVLLSALSILGIAYLRVEESGRALLPDFVHVFGKSRTVESGYATFHVKNVGEMPRDAVGRDYRDELRELGYRKIASEMLLLKTEIDTKTYASFSREMTMSIHEFLKKHPWSSGVFSEDPMRSMAEMLVDGAYVVQTPRGLRGYAEDELVHRYASEMSSRRAMIPKSNVVFLHEDLVLLGTGIAEEMAYAMEDSMLLPREYWSGVLPRAEE